MTTVVSGSVGGDAGGDYCHVVDSLEAVSIDLRDLVSKAFLWLFSASSLHVRDQLVFIV